MKKNKQIERHKLHTKNVFRRQNRYHQRSEPYKAGITQRTKQPIRISAPEVLCLIQNTESSLKFIQKLKNIYLIKKKTAYIKLNACNFVSLEACLLLVAELEALRIIKPSFEVFGNFSSNEFVNFVLHEYGVFDFFKIPINQPKALQNIPHFKILPITQGTEDFSEVQKGLVSLFPETPETKRSPAGRALLEATNNAAEHAYNQKHYKCDTPRKLCKWWCAGMHDQRANRYIFVVYDRGAGIPNTLGEKPLYQHILDKPDHEKIEEIMRIGRTPTQTDSQTNGRGHGTGCIQRLVTESKKGDLIVIRGIRI